MQNAEVYRLFVAISVPERVKDEMERAQTEFRRELPEHCVRWAKREQFHLTLKFLGNVPASRAEQLVVAVQQACRGFPALRLRAVHVGFFPNQKSPRVIWVGAQDDEEVLPKLQEEVESAVRDVSVEPAGGRFVGHVTLGRVKMIKRPQAHVLSRLAQDLKEKVFGDWTADKVEIIRSELLPGGAQYTTLADVALGRDNSAWK